MRDHEARALVLAKEHALTAPHVQGRRIHHGRAVNGCDTDHGPRQVRGEDLENGFEDPLTGQLNFFFMNGYLFCVARDDD